MDQDELNKEEEGAALEMGSESQEVADRQQTPEIAKPPEPSESPGDEPRSNVNEAIAQSNEEFKEATEKKPGKTLEIGAWFL